MAALIIGPRLVRVRVLPQADPTEHRAVQEEGHQEESVKQRPELLLLDSQIREPSGLATDLLFRRVPRPQVELEDEANDDYDPRVRNHHNPED